MGIGTGLTDTALAAGRPVTTTLTRTWLNRRS